MTNKMIILIVLILTSSAVHARDDKLMFPVQEAIERGIAEKIIDGSVKFYFGDSTHPQTASTFGEIKTNKKTNAFNKTDREACEWAFLSAIKAFHEKAVKLGANGVINIHSNYKNNAVKNDSEYQCGAGSFVAGVALKGEFVKF